PVLQGFHGNELLYLKGNKSHVSTYHTSGELLKKFKAKDIKKVDEKNSKWQPMYLEAENVQSNHKTIIEFKNYKVNVGVSDDLFTTRSLEK
ncbi:MAG: outer membrane lipoprotein-sorting protein, partial [Silvanigrellaceae bacterium]|nr:outer membrane lipoprotein-sorting protein [Silvanigrellaceae bacterium]